MPRFAKKELPEGWGLHEFPGNRWQAYRLANPEEEGPIRTRRQDAIRWIIQHTGEQALKTQR